MSCDTDEKTETETESDSHRGIEVRKKSRQTEQRREAGREQSRKLESARENQREPGIHNRGCMRELISDLEGSSLVAFPVNGDVLALQRLEGGGMSVARVGG